MKTKIIPFDLELAKKIQAGEIEGKIRTRDGNKARILCTDVQDAGYPMVAAAKENHSGKERARSYTLGGFLYSAEHESNFDLVLEVPDDEPQFKPFDKVLIRNKETDKWHPCFYATTDGILYYTIDCRNWKQCIPYAGNEHLVGTTNNPKED